MKRLFIAVRTNSFETELKPVLNRLQKQFENYRINWVRPESLHLTLAFLGNVPEERLRELNKTLIDFCGSTKSFKLSLGKIDVLPKRKPRIVYLEVSAQDGSLPTGQAGASSGKSENLKKLMVALNRELSKRGFITNFHANSPHLTLGRVGDGINSSRLVSLARTILISKRIFKIKKVELVESKLRPDGVKYKTVVSYNLIS